MADDHRNKDGTFREGHPGYKQKGARSKLSKRAFEFISANFDAIVLKMISKALDGETDAGKLLLSVALPKDQPLEFANGLTPDDLIEEIKAGNVTPDEGKKLAATLKSLTEISKLPEIVERLEKLCRTQRKSNEHRGDNSKAGRSGTAHTTGQQLRRSIGKAKPG